MSRACRILAAFVAALGLVVAAGCASGPSTTVVLLPDEDGHVGAVIVGGAKGPGQRVASAYSATIVPAGAAAPAASPPQRETVESRYAELLKAQPSKPQVFILNFLLDTATLTDASRGLLPSVIEAARRRQPTEISIFGHADATGSESHNDRLSAERARVVAALLRKADPSIGEIEIASFGDRVPLVPSDGRTPEPRNRRVEIQIL